MIYNFLPIPDAKSLPLYRMVLNLAALLACVSAAKSICVWVNPHFLSRNQWFSVFPNNYLPRGPDHMWMDPAGPLNCPRGLPPVVCASIPSQQDRDRPLLYYKVCMRNIKQHTRSITIFF